MQSFRPCQNSGPCSLFINPGLAFRRRHMGVFLTDPPPPHSSTPRVFIHLFANMYTTFPASATGFKPLHLPLFSAYLHPKKHLLLLSHSTHTPTKSGCAGGNNMTAMSRAEERDTEREAFHDDNLGETELRERESVGPEMAER